MCDDLGYYYQNGYPPWTTQAAPIANVACKQAGCPGNATAVKEFGENFDEGQGIIWMDNLACTGQEAKIQDCPHSGKNIMMPHDDCDHSEDLGVCCAGGCRGSAPTCDAISFNIDGGLCDGMPIDQKACGAKGVADMVTSTDKVLPSLFAVLFDPGHPHACAATVCDCM